MERPSKVCTSLREAAFWRVRPVKLLTAYANPWLKWQQSAVTGLPFTIGLAPSRFGKRRNLTNAAGLAKE